MKGVKVPFGGSDEEGPGRVIALESTVVPVGGEALAPPPPNIVKHKTQLCENTQIHILSLKSPSPNI